MRGFALILIAVLQGASALAQVPVRVLVKDPGGATVVGAAASVKPLTNADDAMNATQALDSKTGADGSFSLNLLQGRYELCITASGFQTSCTEISIRDQPSTAVNVTLQTIPNTVLAPSSVMDNRLRDLSGNAAVDCGRVRVGNDPAEASACVLKQFQSAQAFRVRYDVQGIDSEVSIGLASNSNAVYIVAFDSFGTSPRGLAKHSKLMDSNHNVVLSCSFPVKLRVTATGKVTCLGSGKTDSNFLGPNF